MDVIAEHLGDAHGGGGVDAAMEEGSQTLVRIYCETLETIKPETDAVLHSCVIDKAEAC